MKPTKHNILVESRTRANPFHVPLVRRKGKTYLTLDPARSKLGAAIMNGLQHPPQPTDIILYLGASAGYTVSFLAQTSPLILAIEVSPLMARDLVLVAKDLPSIAPILADARTPTNYAHRIVTADYLFCDISQPDQLDIFIHNVELALKPSGYAALSLKTRSINAIAAPDDIFKNALMTLTQKYTVIEHHRLDPYQKDHYLIVIQK